MSKLSIPDDDVKKSMSFRSDSDSRRPSTGSSSFLTPSDSPASTNEMISETTVPEEEDVEDKGMANKQNVEKRSRPWPENISNNGDRVAYCDQLKQLASRWSYSYMNPIMQKGKRQFKDGAHLVQDDLYEVPGSMRADHLVSTFWDLYSKNPSLRHVIFRLTATDLLAAATWELATVISKVTLPIAMGELLRILEQYDGTQEPVINKALPYAFIMAIAAIISALAHSRTLFLSNKAGIACRASLTSAMYEQALKLTPSGRQGLTSGTVTNMVATDTQKIFDVMIEAQNIWSCPLLLILVAYFLWSRIGPEMVIGIACLIASLPFVQILVKRMLAIRRERAALCDVRINIITSMLQGIQFTKLNHHEKQIETKIGAIRGEEMILLDKELKMWGYVLTCAVASPIMATLFAFATYVLVDEQNILTPSKVFSALLMFSILRFPINLTARLVGKIAQASDAIRRIELFLEREIRQEKEAEPPKTNNPADDEFPLRVKNGAFKISPQAEMMSNFDWEADSETDCQQQPKEADCDSAGFMVREVDFDLGKSQVLAVVGTVGAGKSVLLRALLGEIEVEDGTGIFIKGKISYAAQQPFILNASLKDNIVFGSEFNSTMYEKVLDACCLRPDIEQLGAAGDLTEIGERGVTLSGGQKQRVALARSVYVQPDVALLDDCFSALDATTGSAVFDGLFRQEKSGALGQSATVLVTHAIHFLPRVDRILVLDKGRPTFYGTWDELQVSKDNGHDVVQSIQEPAPVDKPTNLSRKHDRSGLTLEDGKIMTEETREFGVATMKVWFTWFKRAGGWPFFFLQLLLLVLDRAVYVLSDWWLAAWTDGAYEDITILGFQFAPQVAGKSAQVVYVLVYTTLVILSCIATGVRYISALRGGAHCARIMFKEMSESVLRAPMSYFDTTPLGRILNRFTYDVEVLDLELSVSMAGLMVTFSWLVAAIAVMTIIVPWVCMALLPVSVAYVFIQLYYRMSGPDMQRIDAVSRSPIQASLAEGLEGASTIRAFRKEGIFSSNFRKHVDRNSSAMLNFVSCQLWLGLRIEILGSVVTFALSATIVCFNHVLNIPPGLVGLAIQWGVVFTAALNYFFARLSESEARITSIERVSETSKLPKEAAWDTDKTIDLDPKWPSNGGLEFSNVSMRYRKDLPLALNSISFKLKPGSRCGVVGRTGSGKSSLTAALFRLVEIENGSIFLDGVALSSLGLSDVRGRPNCMHMITQDPVLFEGSMRDCLDPFHLATDDQLVEALNAVEYREVMKRGKDVLDDTIEEGGSNFSVGERQLLCLARAIISSPRLLVLDEATASIDSVSDAFIQKMLRSRFNNTTLITVAHRLHTVADYDMILVMENGHAVEFGPPKELLKNLDGIYTSLVKATGPESAAQLHLLADANSSFTREFDDI